LQFTVILDFMVLSPLGALLMPAMDISATQFGRVVSAYAFSAGLSGLLAAGFAAGGTSNPVAAGFTLPGVPDWDRRCSHSERNRSRGRAYPGNFFIIRLLLRLARGLTASPQTRYLCCSTT